MVKVTIEGNVIGVQTAARRLAMLPPELMVECVNVHGRCYGGWGAPCPYCEPVMPLRTTDGRFYSPTQPPQSDDTDDHNL